MSVLYKALQKAEKENEARQSASSGTNFDPQRLAASGALRFAGGRGQAISRVIMGAIVIVAVVGGGAFLLFKDSLLPAPQVASAPAAPVLQPPPPSAAEETPAAGAPASTPATVPPDQVASVPETAPTESAVTSPQEEQVAMVAQEASPPSAEVEAIDTVPPEVGEKQLAAAPPAASVRVPPRPAARAVPEKPEPMPQLAADSPARMLSPPISISRSEFSLAGVGGQVQVREVSQAARSNVAAGYDALIGGHYDTALGFYESALKDEPTSVLALLGRGAALQKLGRGQDAQASYEQVLKVDPQNREALSNLTTIVAERSPQDAVTRLLELERQYPNFSPVKAQIGLSYAKAGSLQLALDYFRRALVLSPESLMYHYNLALVLDHLGRREQAVASYERVLASLAGGRGSSDLSAVDIERRVRFLRTR